MTAPRLDAPHLSEDRLLDLALGLLRPPAGVAEREHLSGCASCAHRLREVAASHARARGRAESWIVASATSRVAAKVTSPDPVPAAPVATVSELPHRGIAPQAPRPSRSRTRWLALAAGFATVVGVFVLLRPAWQPDRRPGQAWLPDPERVGLTRDARVPEADSLVHRGLEAYARRDLAAARDLLGGVTVTGPLEQARRIYLASALLELDRAREAIPLLTGVDLAQVAEPWRSESRWLLAEALARAGRRAAADSVLRELAEVPSPAGDRAREALRSR